jgi:hypothetical protein
MIGQHSDDRSAPAEAHGILDAPVDGSLGEGPLLAAPGFEVLPAVGTDRLQNSCIFNSYY